MIALSDLFKKAFDRAWPLPLLQPPRPTLRAALERHLPSARALNYAVNDNDMRLLREGFPQHSSGWMLLSHPATGEYHCRVGNQTSGAKTRRVDAIVHAVVNYYDHLEGVSPNYGHFARYESPGERS